ncbi:MAG: FAD-dependent oxidoreductase [Ginsengibacter sp.]
MSYAHYKEKFPAAFPKLSSAQIAQIAEVAECRTYQDGDALFKAGQAEFKFHVIQKGEIEIFDRSGDNPVLILTHQPLEFTGDIANFAGRSSNVDAIARGTVEVYEICAAELKTIIGEWPELSDIILNAFIARSIALSESHFTGLRVIGSQYSKDTFRIRDFLSRNRVMFTWVDVAHDPNVGELLDRFHVQPGDTPIVASGNEWILRNPSNIILAEKIGIKQEFKEDLYDLVIAGGGPAGLAAAVYGASEGLKTIVLEMMAPGGQAGTSSKIENYLGFPTGVSGEELAARATIQAEKFGARLDIPSKVVGLSFENKQNVFELDTGEKFLSKSLLIATGAEYKKLDIPNIEKFEGRGIYYAATKMEATICKDQQVAVVGGGNSAGQAAIFLSMHVSKVFLIVRGKNLSITMSKYLEQRIKDCENIELYFNTQITAVKGNEQLEAISIMNTETKEQNELDAVAIFSFIGATPLIEWLPDEIEKDEKGFIITGVNAGKSPRWTEKRQPYLLETTRPGVFAAGDVRSNSVKRVSSAVGEGSMAVQFVHEYLKDL